MPNPYGSRTVDMIYYFANSFRLNRPRVVDWESERKIEELTPARDETRTFRTVSVRNVCYIACRFDFAVPIQQRYKIYQHHATIFHYTATKAVKTYDITGQTLCHPPESGRGRGL